MYEKLPLPYQACPFPLPSAQGLIFYYAEKSADMTSPVVFFILLHWH